MNPRELLKSVGKIDPPCFRGANAPMSERVKDKSKKTSRFLKHNNKTTCNFLKGYFNNFKTKTTLSLPFPGTSSVAKSPTVPSLNKFKLNCQAQPQLQLQISWGLS